MDDDLFVKITGDSITVGAIEHIDQITSVKVADLCTPARGSTHGTCHDCQEAIWMSPESRALAKRFPKAPTLCIQCSLDRLKSGGVQ